MKRLFRDCRNYIEIKFISKTNKKDGRLKHLLCLHCFANNSYLNPENHFDCSLSFRHAILGVRQVDLRTLISAVTGIDSDFPEDAEVPCAPEYDPAAKDNFVELPILLSGYLYYFDIAPKNKLPEIKFYTPVRRYGRDDLALAKGTVAWMKSHGRGEYCDRYMNMLQGICQHRPLDKGKGLQTYVSCLFKKNGDLDMTSYIGPEAFDLKRMAKSGAQKTNGTNGTPRPTLRRGDSNY